MSFQVSVLALVLLSSSALAEPSPPEAASATSFPELTPRATLIAIIKSLDAATNAPISDPRSMSDVILCPAGHIKLSSSDGRPEKWNVEFSLNSRTGGGGYSGRTIYEAIFRRGRLPEISRIQAEPDSDPFNHAINSVLIKRMRDCPMVPNDQLATLLGASDRPTVDVSK